MTESEDTDISEESISEVADGTPLMASINLSNQNLLSSRISTERDRLKALTDKAKALDTQYVSDLRDNAQKMRDKEQSLENRILGAAAIATVGLGGMQMMQGMAEESADEAAERDMKAYLATFTCDYGQGRNIKGGRQAVDCMAVGGNYTGKKCLGLTKQDCMDLKAANLAECPECKALYWDSQDEICVLPSSATATNIAKGIKTGTAVGTMVAGVVLTIASGGSGGVVLIESAGAAISTVAEISMSKAADEFLTRANKCKNATCAEQTIKDELQRMSNLTSSFEDQEIKAIDTEFERLVGLLPNDAKMYDTMLANNQLPWYNLDSWEPEQVWNAVGIGLQMGSIIKNLWGKTTSRLTNTTNKLKSGMTRANAKKLQDLAAQEEKIQKARQLPTNSGKKADQLNTDLKRVQQQQRQLKNQLGMTDEELQSASKAAMNKAEIEKTQAELDKLNQRRLYTTNKNGEQILAPGVTKQEVAEVNLQKEKLTKKIRELGGDVPEESAATTAKATTSSEGRAAAQANREAEAAAAKANQEAEAAAQAKREAEVAAAKAKQEAEAAAKTADDELEIVEIIDTDPGASKQFIRRELESIGPASEQQGFYISSPSKSMNAQAAAYRIRANGDFAATLNTTGYENGDEIVIAMTRADAQAQGLIIDSEGSLIRTIANSNLASLDSKIGKTLGNIRGTPVYIESIEDVGAINGRAICMVKVGDRKIPFYIITGTAGKTGVAAGKWEAFFGITKNSEWFNKGDSIEEIANHYYSSELKQIAGMLDAQIGDLRNTELVLETAGRQSLGGQGIVATLENFQSISIDAVNRYLVDVPNQFTVSRNIKEIKNYLSNL